MNNENKNTGNMVLLAISTDTLAFLKSRTELELLLLDGKDTDALIIEGRIDHIMKMVTQCYNARETKKSVKFVIEGTEIIFK